MSRLDDDKALEAAASEIRRESDLTSGRLPRTSPTKQFASTAPAPASASEAVHPADIMAITRGMCQSHR